MLTVIVAQEIFSTFILGHQRQASDSTERTLTPPFKEMLKMQEAIDSGEPFLLIFYVMLIIFSAAVNVVGKICALESQVN